MKKDWVQILHVFGRVLFFAAVFIAVPMVLGTQTADAGGGGAAEEAANIVTDKTLLGFAAMGAVGISCLTSAYALAKIGAAAMGAMSEKPEIGGRALVFLGMTEGIAIYGLIIAIMILNKI